MLRRHDVAFTFLLVEKDFHRDTDSTIDLLSPSSPLLSAALRFTVRERRYKPVRLTETRRVHTFFTARFPSTFTRG